MRDSTKTSLYAGGSSLALVFIGLGLCYLLVQPAIDAADFYERGVAQGEACGAQVEDYDGFKSCAGICAIGGDYQKDNWSDGCRRGLNKKILSEES